MATGRARAFWMARERQRLEEDERQHAEVNGCDGTYHATLGRVNGFDRPTAAEADVWAGLYCTLRDKRRARSRTPGGSAAAAATTNPAPPRSLTPSSLSSGRTTPSPSPGPQFRMMSRTMSEEVLSTCSDSSRTSRTACVPLSPSRYKSTCWLEPRPVPIHYSSTVYMTVGSTRKRYVEEVTFQTRLVPRRYSESMTTATTIPTRRFTSVLEIQCLTPGVHIISLDEHKLIGMNGMEDEHEA